MLHVNTSVFAVAAVSAVALALLPDRSSAADAETKACVQRVLREWRGGRVGSNHPVPCYRAALAGLPEDMQIYSDAPQQIQRALHARLATLKSKRRSGVAGARRTLEAVAVTAPDDHRFPLPVLVSAAGFVVVVTIGFGLRLGHRLRGR